MSGMNLLMSDSRGVYIPRDFADFGEHWRGVTAEVLAILAAGPEHEQYWDAWDSILYTASYVDEKDNVWYLHQDGDLWIYCEALMTDQEYYDFFGVERSDLDADSRLETDNWYDTSAELH